jgi:two-component system nitrogen regulation response regulator GlnG
MANPNSKGVVLVADDDMAIRTVLNQALKRAGFDVRITSNFNTLVQWVEDGEADCVISDVIMPDGDAFEVLPKIQSLRKDLPVILISAQNTFMTALKAQEAGAYEYLPKPFDLDDLIEATRRAISEPKDNKSAQSLEDYNQNMPLVGRSAIMQEIYRSIARLMHSDLPVLLSGETGTGKRLTARVLHEFGNRKQNPFVAVNIATLPDNLVEAELFGYQDQSGKANGSKIRAADGGTLYLDEVGDLPLLAQTRLLRVLLEGEFTPVGSAMPLRVDVRIIASSTKNMNELIAQGRFREDLYYRLNVVPINLPALRERMGDIPDLARHFLKISQSEGAQSRHLDQDAMTILKEHYWPGNIRELENLIRRICILYPQETITATIISTEIRNSGYFKQGLEKASNTGFQNIRAATEYFVNRYFEEFDGDMPPLGVYHRFLQEFEYPLISNTLAACNGNQIKAAKLLGLNRNTLRKKIQSHGIKIIKTAK